MPETEVVVRGGCRQTKQKTKEKSLPFPSNFLEMSCSVAKIM